MMNEGTKQFLAIDLGATSGRSIVGSVSEGKVCQQELTRFPNAIVEQGGHCYWDILSLYQEIIRALKTAAEQGIDIQSIGIDTWGVDFVCIGEDDALLRAPRAYRDTANFRGMDDYLKQVMTPEKLYQATGTQIIYFNSLFQLHTMRLDGDAALKHASQILFMPDALIWMLTGQRVCEQTIASTSQLINPHTKELDEELLSSVGLKRSMFGKQILPGTIVGTLSQEVQRLAGLGPIPVVAVAGHDTASAVAAIPAHNEHFAFLSSGTWSLMGIETPQPTVNEWSREHNFTNEGGIDGTTRFLKNICGMWLYEQCRKEGFKKKEERGERKISEERGERREEREHSRPLSHSELTELAMKAEPFRSLIDPDNPSFANPPSMVAAIQDYCQRTNQPIPKSAGELCRCIFESLALRYRQVFLWLREVAPFPIDTLHIIGGGSLNGMLNQFTANACGIDVLAGPQECTAAGNILMQAKAAGKVADRWEMRQIVANSTELRHFSPQQQHVWDEAYNHFLDILSRY